MSRDTWNLTMDPCVDSIVTARMVGFSESVLASPIALTSSWNGQGDCNNFLVVVLSG